MRALTAIIAIALAAIWIAQPQLKQRQMAVKLSQARSMMLCLALCRSSSS